MKLHHSSIGYALSLLCVFVFFTSPGLELWERARDNWLAHHQNRKKNHQKNNSSDHTTDEDDDSSTIRAAIPLDVDEIIDVVFAPRWRGGGVGGGGATSDGVGIPERFSQNVPLPQMVDILQDLWEAEGLDV